MKGLSVKTVFWIDAAVDQFSMYLIPISIVLPKYIYS
jgi:hypothetical protein